MWIAPHLRRLEIKNKDVRESPSLPHTHCEANSSQNHVKSDQFLQSG